MPRTSLKHQVYAIERRNPKTGYLEQTTYEGSLKDKPAGWRLIRR